MLVRAWAKNTPSGEENKSVMDCGYPGIGGRECKHSDCQFNVLFKSCTFTPAVPVAQPSTAVSKRLMSIIIVCHKQAGFLTAAMNSVTLATQSLRVPYERLVVDDASDCFTSSITAHAKQYHFKLFRNPRNMGLALTRNLAVTNYSKGDDIVFLDADDLLGRDYLLKAEPFLGKYEFIYANQVFVTEHTRFLWETKPSITVEDIAAKGELPIPNIVQRSVYRRLRGFSASMIYGHEDYAFWIQIVRSQVKMKKIETIGSYYRIREQSMSRNGDYQRDGLHMVKLAHPGLYLTKQVCHSLRKLQTSPALEAKLERAIQYGRECTAWIIWVLHKRKNQCASEMEWSRQRAIRDCWNEVHHFNVSTDRLKVLSYVLTFPTLAHCTRRMSKTPLPPAPTEKDHNTFESNDRYQWYNENNADLRWTCGTTVPSAGSDDKGNTRIPRILHFVYGLSPGAPFQDMHRNAIASAYKAYPDYDIFLHMSHLPKPSSQWSQVEHMVRIVWVNPDSNVFGRRCFQHHAHRSDYIRLRALNEYGGIYMDIDTLTINPIPSSILESSSFVIARQDTPRGYGLCNAVMASTKNSSFSRIWLDNYRSFRSMGMDSHWDEHSVRLPLKLSTCKNAKVTILSPKAFFPFYWHNADKIVFGNRKYYEMYFSQPYTYTIHLWVSGQTKSYGEMFDRVLTCDGYTATAYNTAVCKLLPEYYSSSRELEQKTAASHAPKNLVKRPLYMRAKVPSRGNTVRPR